MCWLKSKHLINALGDNVSNTIMIKGAKRLRNRFHDRPALVKNKFWTRTRKDISSEKEVSAEG